MKLQARVDRMFDYLVEHPNAFISDMAADQGIEVKTARYVVKALRDWLGDEDDINVVCDVNPEKPNGERIYNLVGTMEAAQPWAITRLVDSETRLRTMRSVITSIRRGTNPRTLAGKKARVLERGLNRLVEDIDDIEAEVS